MGSTGSALSNGRRRIVAILSVAVLASLPGSGRTDQPPAVASGALVGSWRLVSVEERQPGGETSSWMGPKPLGLLIYDRAGNVSVQIMRDPTFRPAGAGPPSPQDGYYAYFGRYDVKERDAVVVHRIQGSMRPGEVGADYTRSVRLRGDRLVLGLTPTRSVTWQRVK